MKTDIDIWRTAHLLTKTYGAQAAFIAAGNVDDMIARGDVKGEAVWKRVLASIKELQRTAPHAGERIN